MTSEIRMSCSRTKQRVLGSRGPSGWGCMKLLVPRITPAGTPPQF